MYGFLDGMPFAVIFFSLFGIVVARALVTYGIGRMISSGLRGSRLARRLGPALTRAEELVGRYGPPVVTLSFATVGFQTAANLAAGTARMRFVRYVIAMLVGALLWALIYSLGGMAVVVSWWHLFTRSPALAITVAVVVVVAAAAVITYRARRRARRRETVGDRKPESADTTEAR